MAKAAGAVPSCYSLMADRIQMIFTTRTTILTVTVMGLALPLRRFSLMRQACAKIS